MPVLFYHFIQEHCKILQEDAKGCHDGPQLYILYTKVPFLVCVVMGHFVLHPSLPQYHLCPFLCVTLFWGQPSQDLSFLWDYFKEGKDLQKMFREMGVPADVQLDDDATPKKKSKSALDVPIDKPSPAEKPKQKGKAKSKPSKPLAVGSCKPAALGKPAEKGAVTLKGPGKKRKDHEQAAENGELEHPPKKSKQMDAPKAEKGAKPKRKMKKGQKAKKVKAAEAEAAEAEAAEAEAADGNEAKKKRKRTNKKKQCADEDEDLPSDTDLDRGLPKTHTVYRIIQKS